MEKDNKKVAKVVLIVVSIIATAFMAFVIIMPLLVTNVTNTARQRACCMDAGGTFNRDSGKCENYDQGMYKKCMGQ